jgi:plastocyanin
MPLHVIQFPLLVALTLAAVLPLAIACGSGDSSGDDGVPTVETRDGGGNPTQQPSVEGPVTAEIDQEDLTFIPEKVTLKVGEVLLIKNSETAIHTANIDGKNITGNMKKGDEVRWKATAPGEYKVTCDYHPQMKATITVTP